MIRAAIFQIIAVDRGNHHMFERELGYRLCKVFRLMRVERAGHTGFNITKRAGTRAGIAHDHDSCMLLFPAFADIGTGRFFTYLTAVIADVRRLLL